MARIDAAIRSGAMPAAIVIIVQSPKTNSFLDANGLPAETAFIKDLIPTIDRTYRIVASREGRAIDGHSMGGSESLRLGFKYPDMFGTVSAISPALSAGRTGTIVVDDPETPWGMVAKNADRIRGRMHIRMNSAFRRALCTRCGMSFRGWRAIRSAFTKRPSPNLNEGYSIPATHRLYCIFK